MECGTTSPTRADQQSICKNFTSVDASSIDSCESNCFICYCHNVRIQYVDLLGNPDFKH